MLIKSINLNLKIIQNHISASASILMGGLVLSVTYMGIFVLLIWLIALLIVGIKGYCKLFCDSTYREEADLYMTLPISNEVSMWGKVLACALWNMLLAAVSTVGIIIMTLSNDGIVDTLADPLFADVIAAGISPLQTGIFMGLLPLTIIISTCYICFSIMTIQTAWKNLRYKGHGVVLAIILSGICSSALNKLVDLSLEHGANFILMEFGLQILYVALIGAMYCYCKRGLSYE